MLTAVAGCGLVVVDSSEAMIGLRLLQGAAAAGVPPVAQAYLVRSAPAGQSGRAVGSMMVAVLGTLASQTIAGLLEAVAGWRVAVLVLAGVLAAVTAAWAAVVLEPSNTEAPQAPPPPLRRLLADRRVSSAYVVAALLFGSYWTLLAGLGETLRFERFDLSASVAGLVPMFGVAGVLATVASGRAVDRFRQRGPMLALSATGAVLALVLSEQRSLGGFVVVVGLFLTVYWALLPIASVQVARHAPPESTATALARSSSARSGSALRPGASARACCSTRSRSWRSRRRPRGHSRGWSRLRSRGARRLVTETDPIARGQRRSACRIVGPQAAIV